LSIAVADDCLSIAVADDCLSIAVADDCLSIAVADDCWVCRFEAGFRMITYLIKIKRWMLEGKSKKSKSRDQEWHPNHAWHKNLEKKIQKKEREKERKRRKEGGEGVARQ
jgi:hypothetical protein